MPTDIKLPALAELLAKREPEARILVAIAGAPASGKSTIAEKLTEMLNMQEPGSAALLPMDGYHFDDLYLVPAGLRPFKGRPDTFDVGGLRHTLQRLKTRNEDFVAVPVFDREIEIARAGARRIDRTARIIIVEGNYLLLKHSPWNTLKPLFDVSVMVDTPEDVLRERLTARWVHHQLDEEEIRFKLDEIDLPNGRTVRDESTPADFRINN